MVCRLKKLDGDAVLEQAQAGRMGGALAGAVEELVRRHLHIQHTETCTYRLKGGLSTHEGRLVWLVQVKCEKEDQASSLEPLSFTKELKINDIDFVQDFQRYEGRSTSNFFDHEPSWPPRASAPPYVSGPRSVTLPSCGVSNTSHRCLPPFPRLPGWSRCCPWSGRASVRTAPVSPPSMPT